jgi:hypothetical protein
MGTTKHQGTFIVEDLVIKDDMIKQNAAYISGTASSPFTAFTSATTIGDDGVYYVNGTAGALVLKLPAPVAGKQVTVVYTATGQVEDNIGYCRLSSSAYPIVAGNAGTQTITSYAVDIVTPCAVSLYGINSKWYLSAPATGQLHLNQ